MYFILSGGKQPPGNDPRDIAWNLSRRNLRLENINEEALHLLGMMMSLNKADRPATSEALRYGSCFLLIGKSRDLCTRDFAISFAGKYQRGAVHLLGMLIIEHGWYTRDIRCPL